MKHGWVASLSLTSILPCRRQQRELEEMIRRAASIGYETVIKRRLLCQKAPVKEAEIDVDMFKHHTDEYTIVDVRNEAEVKENKDISQ